MLNQLLNLVTSGISSGVVEGAKTAVLESTVEVVSVYTYVKTLNKEKHK